jgi:hypothetical protein
VSVPQHGTVEPCAIEDRSTHVATKEARLSLGVFLRLPVDVRKVRSPKVALPEGRAPKIRITKVGPAEVELV